FKGAPRRGDYAAAKHAVIALTKTAAGEHAQDRIQINCLCPGPIDTALQHASEVLVNPADPNYERRRFESAIPMGRYGSPEEVADLAAFLLSGAVPYLTGVAIPLDGALSQSDESHRSNQRFCYLAMSAMRFSSATGWWESSTS
ncbi:MAG: SDR family oxidoreductase, partial [Candidatus Binataceae bacterium]